MERISLGTGLEFSRLVYGMWRLGDDADRSSAHICAKVEACLDQGITTMDHADIYGGYGVEELFGAALKGTGLRQRLEIVTKCGIVMPAGRHAAAPCKYYNTGAAHIRASAEQSLRLLGTDYIDLLLIHRPDPFMDPQETGAVLDALVAEGKVRAVGVSNFRPWDLSLLQSAMTSRLVTNQIELSLIAHQPFVNGDLAACQRAGMPVMAWSPLGGGRMMTAEAGALPEALDRFAAHYAVDRAAVAVAWLLAHPARILPVLGTNNLERIRTLSDALKVTLSRTDWFQLYEAAIGQPVP